MSTRSSWKKCSSKTSSISFFSDCHRKFFGYLANFFRLVCQNWLQELQRRNLIEKKVFKSNNLFPSISDFELLIFRLVAEKIGSVFKAAFYVSIGNFCWKTVSERKKFLGFRIFCSKSSDFFLKIWHGCQTSRRHLQKNKRREQNMEKER